MITRREFGGAAALALWVTGKGRAAPAPIPLRAGPVTAVFDPAIAFLRYIKYGDHEILRGVYAAVRDKTWGTVAPRVSNVVAEARADSFRLTFDVDNVEGDIDFGWRGTITGDAKGTIRFEFNGRARSTFLKNRLGFAVLHPIKECAGKPCTIEKAGGLKESGTFPDAISPNQPFLDMAAISHEVAPGVTAEVRFEGDLFEMEDHRNWTDNNYKTYCTPLARPFPVEVQRDQQVKQAITIKLTGAAAAVNTASRELLIGVAPGKPVKLPSIGLGFAADQPPLTAAEVTRLRALRPAHLRVELKLAEPGWEKALAEASRHAPIEAAVFVSGNAEAELRQLAATAAHTRIARWLLFSDKLAPLARQHLHNAPIVIGTNEYFTELNRGRPDAALLDGSCYSVTPQVHAFDNQSLVENLEGQAHTVRSAHRFLSGKPVHVTPVTLLPRATARIDPRQATLFGAVWTLGSIKCLSESGAASITYYQTHGPAGVMPVPLYHVLADVAEFAGGSVQALESSDPLQTCALALEAAVGKRRRVLVANLTSETKVVTLDAAWLGPKARVATLDEQNTEDANRQPERFRLRTPSLVEASSGRYRLAMLPYSITRLDRA